MIDETHQDKRYVYNGDEVVCTGRVARRRKILRGKPTEFFDELLEITPVKELAIDWKRWVNIAELYEITE